MKLCIIGEDNRSIQLKKLYGDKNVDIKEADVIVCPIPFSKDGVNINNSNMSIDSIINIIKSKNKIIVSGAIKKDVITKLEENNIKVIDLMNYEDFVIKNAIATSEGAIKKAIELTDYTLNNSNILVLGFGRIGKILSHNLTGFGANIFVEARKNKDIALIKSMGYNDVDLKYLDEVLPNMDIIFNTIPFMVLDRRRVNLLKKDACVIDVASFPGGVDFDELNNRKIKNILYLGVPSKDSPYSAAKYIKETIDEVIGEDDSGRED